MSRRKRYSAEFKRKTLKRANEDVSLLENAVWNRGGSIKFFDSEMEAKYWLRIS